MNDQKDKSVQNPENEHKTTATDEKDGDHEFEPRPKNITDAEWEMMRWKNPEKYGKPEFTTKGENQPGEEKEFFFPRYAHHGAEFQLTNSAAASHWHTTDQTYKSEYISTHSIKQRNVDRGNLRSRWHQERKDDKESRFGVSKHGVPVKMGEKNQTSETVSRLDVGGDKPVEPPRPSIDDPYYFGDPYVEDPSKFFKEKRKHPKQQPSSPSSSSSSSSSSSPSSEEDSSSDLEDEPEEKNPRPRSPPTPPLKIRKKRKPPLKNNVVEPPAVDNVEPPDDNGVLKPKPRVCIDAPRFTPIYVDDSNGTRHTYCTSGLACFYVNKSNYGKIPQYLKDRNRELGRPDEPDFKTFYRNHRCRYHIGKQSCRICGKKKSIHEEENKDDFTDEENAMRPETLTSASHEDNSVKDMTDSGDYTSVRRQNRTV